MIKGEGKLRIRSKTYKLISDGLKFQMSYWVKLSSLVTRHYSSQIPNMAPPLLVETQTLPLLTNVRHHHCRSPRLATAYLASPTADPNSIVPFRKQRVRIVF